MTHPAPLRAAVRALCGFAALLPLLAAGQAAAANTEAEDRFIEEVTIIGTRERAQQVTGAAHYIGPEELKQYRYSDVQRILRQVPGVSIQVEDGYGLRPNISIRGVATERSGRITLLEDNVLIAPAPYSAPSAYYFPTPGRMHAFEVLKGPAAITQGPYTIGGAFNMVSTPVPAERGGVFTAEAGEDATYRLHAAFGETLASGLGYLLETHQWRSDGYQSIDRSGNDTGLDVADYTFKLRWAPEGSRQRLALKVQWADQTSEQSYLGLTDADFGDDATRRYGLSALDEIDTDHDQIMLQHEVDLSEGVRLSTTAYNNEHERGWFKTEGIDLDGSAGTADYDGTGWFDVIQAINRGEALDGVAPGALAAILDGADTPVGSIQLRNNDRSYFSRGIQSRLDAQFTTGALSHALELGVRYHEDEEDRLQRNSNYQQLGGTLLLNELGPLGNAGNQIQSAEAWALHVYDRIEVGRWTVTPGLRYEVIDQRRVRFETRPGRTEDPSARTAANFRDSRDNDTQIWLPGIGVTYALNDRTRLVAGVHKGFTAPSSAPGVDPEEAINYELGVRWIDGVHQAEVMGFLSDYENLLGVCTASSGSNCTIGDAFNGDAATVAGVELLAATDLGNPAGLSIPVSLSYTYIDGEFDTDVADTDFFGDVSAGDPIPYIPEQQWQARVGLAQGRWSVDLSANYIDEVCVRASCGAFERTDEALILDVAGRYAVSERLDLFARVENLADDEDIMGRQPYGARPNRSRTAAVGLSLQL